MIGGNGHDAGGRRDHGTGGHGRPAGNSSDSQDKILNICGVVLAVAFTVSCSAAMIGTVVYYAVTLTGLWR